MEDKENSFITKREVSHNILIKLIDFFKGVLVIPLTVLFYSQPYFIDLKILKNY